MADITNLFPGGFKPPRADQPEAPDSQLRKAMEMAGITPPPELLFDGKIHRFSISGKKKDDAGWYVAYDDKIPAGAFGNWRDGTSQTWRGDTGREVTLAEEMTHKRRIAEARKIQKEQQAQKQDTAADTVSIIWDGAAEASDLHPYLQAKQVAPHGVRVTGDGRLIVPMYVDGELRNVQYIDDKGGKKFHGQGATAGGCFIVGDPSESQLVVCEGFADAATIHEVTGLPAICSFSAGNMPAVAEYAKGLNSRLVIVADNDESGTGQRYGAQASERTGSRLVIPPTEGQDANDFWLSGGDLASLILPPTDDYLIPADEFCSQPAAIKWLIKGVVQRDALMMVHGPSGGGKTFVVLDQVCHVAAGKDDWHGHKIHGGTVVYLAGEGHAGMRARLAAWKRHNEADKLDMYISRSGTDLNTPEGYNKVRDSLYQLPTKPAAVVVDTLHRFLAGDENSSQDAKTMIDACGAIQQEFGCTVLLVHHTGVSEDSQHRARGSSAWKGALDLEFSVVPGGDDKPIEFVQRKAKDSEIIQPHYFEIERHELDWIDEDGERVSTGVLVAADKAEVLKVNKKLGEDIAVFEKAWWASGCEKVDGMPHVSSSALQRFLLDSGICKTEGTAKQYVKPGSKRLVFRLIEADILCEKSNGFAVTDPGLQVRLILAKKEGG